MSFLGDNADADDDDAYENAVIMTSAQQTGVSGVGVGMFSMSEPGNVSAALNVEGGKEEGLRRGKEGILGLLSDIAVSLDWCVKSMKACADQFGNGWCLNRFAK